MSRQLRSTASSLALNCTVAAIVWAFVAKIVGSPIGLGGLMAIAIGGSLAQGLQARWVRSRLPPGAKQHAAAISEAFDRGILPTDPALAPYVLTELDETRRRLSKRSPWLVLRVTIGWPPAAALGVVGIVQFASSRLGTALLCVLGAAAWVALVEWGLQLDRRLCERNLRRLERWAKRQLASTRLP